MIHVGRKSYPYMEEVNEGIVRQFKVMKLAPGRVLDVGCGRAALTEAVRKLGWEAWGIEQSAEACETAAKRLDRLIQADLHDCETVARELKGLQFDAVVFSDVLEHVYDPRTVLEKYAPLLKPGGHLMISVPNGVVWTNRLQWLCGRIRYQDTGVMDRTHIRFFTFRTARELVAASGFEVCRTDSTPYLVRAMLPVIRRLRGSAPADQPHNPRALLDSPGYQLYIGRIYPLERVAASLWKGMLAFRIILVGRKAQGHRGIQ